MKLRYKLLLSLISFACAIGLSISIIGCQRPQLSQHEENQILRGLEAVAQCKECDLDILRLSGDYVYDPRHREYFCGEQCAFRFLKKYYNDEEISIIVRDNSEFSE